MRKTITKIVLMAGWLVLVCAQAAHAGVLTIGRTILKANPISWAWAGIQALLELAERHPQCLKFLLGLSFVSQFLGIFRDSTSGFPWRLVLLALSIVAAIVLVALLRHK
jgi:hypothetical protein